MPQSAPVVCARHPAQVPRNVCPPKTRYSNTTGNDYKEDLLVAMSADQPPYGSTMGWDRPLDDIRILAVEQYAAGPFATLQLGELGAEVIKIEDSSVGGDVGRHVPPDAADGDSLFFQTFNHGKESVAIDLRSTAGREVFEALVARSDVVFSNLRGDVPIRLGLRYADLADVNPRIVCCSLSAYGMSGPRASEPGYDYLIQGLTGWMSLTGEPGAPPTKTGLSLVDFASGHVAAASMLAAVHAAQRTGRGGDCDLSLYDVAMNLLTYVATWHLTLGTVPQRAALSAHPTLVPFQNFATTDGWIVIGCAKEIFWQRLVDEIGEDDLRDPRFATFDGRLECRDDVLRRLERHIREHSTDEWLVRLGRQGVPCGPIHDVPAAMREEQVRARGLIRTFDHPTRGQVQVVRSPLRLTDEPGPTRAAGGLGVDTHAVLERVIGASTDDVAEWRKRGAFGDLPAMDATP